MRYPASEKLEIIQIVERSHLPARRTLERLGIPRATFHRWYDRFLTGGVDALEDSSPRPGRVWNRIPQDVRDRIVELALDKPELSPRELAVTFTDTESYFVSEASVYRLLKAHDLITSPAFIVIKAADEFRDKTMAPNQLWQTDFTYLKVIGWGWFYLSTILDDFSRYIIAWKLCTTMKAEDVTDTLNLALVASGCDQATVRQRPRLLSDNGPCYIAGELADWLQDRDMARIWPTFGRVNSLIETRLTTGSSTPRRLVHSRLTVTASTTWPAMSGNGRPTGTRSTARSTAHAARSKTPGVRNGRTASIRDSRRPGSRAR
jgi:putative transposase